MSTSAIPRAAPVRYVLERELITFRRFWRTTLFMHFVTPLLFLAAMGLGVGGLVRHHTGDVHGVSYLEFIAPGLLAGFAVQSAAMGSTWAVLAYHKWMGVYHAAVTTPIESTDVLGGFLLWLAIRTAMQATVFLVAAGLLGGLISWWTPLAVPAAMLGSVAVSAPLAAWSITLDRDVGIAVMLRLGVMPLFLLSGTFFPIQQLPSWLRPAAWLSPLWHVVELCRGATTGSIGAGSVLAHVAVLLGWLVVGWLCAVRTFSRRLNP